MQSLSAALIRGVDAPSRSATSSSSWGCRTWPCRATRRPRARFGACSRGCRRVARALARAAGAVVLRRRAAALGGRRGARGSCRPTARPEVQQPVTIEHHSPPRAHALHRPHPRSLHDRSGPPRRGPRARMATGQRGALPSTADGPGRCGLRRADPGRVRGPAGAGVLLRGGRIPTASPWPPAGDAFAPLRVVVPEAPRASITSRWWFWTGAAVLVAGAVVGTYFLVADDESGPRARPTAYHRRGRLVRALYGLVNPMTQPQYPVLYVEAARPTT